MSRLSWGYRWHGQSMLEVAISLFFFCVFIATITQLLWIFLAQQMLQATTLSAARFAAKASMDNAGVQMLIQNRIKAIPGLQIHIPKIQRVAPTDEDVKTHGIYDARNKRHRLPAEFPELNLSLLTREEQEKFLQLRVLQIEIEYCFSLRVPLAATLIKSATKASIHCQLQQRNKPMLPIHTKASVPLANDFWL
ncbi:hypothetical protein CWE13_03880 [Aliidiomarina shirensis]|uniref:Pilus assembly protein TadE n=1 Tax=Aliidiomarina shirensis TaxID=1048642 RepID=A0A432WYL9_9GAMM|nr:pilus assembly protein [Aliidiomarina shirensis]RUO38781.1 hypothetical protein CWE13_03880 [Aliidiomarina shirensis]